MKNAKKIASLSLASALVATSAMGAFAAESGIYVGGDVNKYYGLSTYIANKGTAVQEMTNAGLTNVKYVDPQNKITSLQGILDAGSLSSALKTIQTGDLNPSYKDAGTGTEVKPAEGQTQTELKVESVSAITSTKLQVKLNKAVDDVNSANFSIPGITISSATLAADKMTVVLSISNALVNQEYTLTATGLKINAEVQPNAVKEFTMPNVSELYSPALSFKDDITQLKADGASSTLVTFKLNDAEGNLVTDAQDVEVSFATTFGSFAEQRVSVQNGVATVLLTSEFLSVDRTAQITATVVNAADQNLIGLKATKNILMTPNPDSGDNETVGASMTDAEANQSDRVIVYFNKEVNIADYVNATTGAIEKATVNVRKDATSVSTGNPVVIKGLMAVPGNNKALQIMLDVDASAANALTDNSDVWVQFIDKTKTVEVDRSLTFKNTDVRKPSMLSVTNEGLRKLVVTFAEPVINDNTANGAKNLNNWTIDGTLLTNTTKFGTPTITVGTFNPATGEDKRNVVTIQLGAGKYFASGSHSVQAANVGDWARLSDHNNVMNTQTLDFVIPEDNDVPSATVEVQSPEQWLVTYNKDVDESAAQFAAKLKLQKYNTTTTQWDNAANTGTAKVDDTNLDLVVTKIDSNKFLVQTDYDWTNVHNTKNTNKNYFNYQYRLNIEADAVTNVANGKKNVEANLVLGGAMTMPDVVSPEIVDIVATAGVPAGTSYEVTMSEPVKLNTTANPEGATDSQSQGFIGGVENWSNIPTATVEFIKKDNSVTIAGKVGTAFVDDYNKVLTVVPVDSAGVATALPAGDWMVVVRAIPDDIGNGAKSATADFKVEGTTPGTSDFDVLWAFADVDHDLKVEKTDLDGDGDTNYDYVFVKFNKPLAISGDFKNALKTSNYTLDGEKMPIGTQIMADIEGYDDLDSVTDSITIRLPQGTLGTNNAPHNINISKYIESTTAGETIGNNGGEKTFDATTGAYDNYDGWVTGMATDIATTVDVLAKLKAVETATDNTETAIDAGEIAAFETAYNAAAIAIAAMPASDEKTAYESELASYVDDVKGRADFATFMAGANGLNATVNAGVTFHTLLDGTDQHDLTVKIAGTNTDRYTVTNDGPVNGDTLNVTLATSTVSVTGDSSAGGADGSITITVADDFWGVSDTVTVDVTNDTTGSETFTINND